MQGIEKTRIACLLKQLAFITCCTYLQVTKFEPDQGSDFQYGTAQL